MELTIDGIVYCFQKYGGISRTFTEILPRMCDLDGELKIAFISPQSKLKHLPVHKQIITLEPWPVEYVIRPYRFWKTYYRQIHAHLNRIRLGSSKHKIWHSTYYTVPSLWAGSQVVSVYDLIHELYPHYFSDVEEVLAKKKRAIQQADYFICNSKTTALDLCEYYRIPESRIRVAHLASSLVYRQKPASEWGLRNPNPFLLYVGMRAYYKRFEDLLTAYAAWKYRTQVDLIAIGPPWDPEELKLLSEFKIQDHVHLYTYLDNESLCDLYNQALAFVYPSLYEGFGIPLVEAMACGCPIVASQIPSTQEVTGDIPYYFDATKTEALIEVLNCVAEQRDAQVKVKQGLQLAANYSWEKTAQATLDVYRLFS